MMGFGFRLALFLVSNTTVILPFRSRGTWRCPLRTFRAFWSERGSWPSVYQVPDLGRSGSGQAFSFCPWVWGIRGAWSWQTFFAIYDAQTSWGILVGKQHLFGFGTVRIVFVLKYNMGVIDFKDPVLGDGNLVGISSWYSTTMSGEPKGAFSVPLDGNRPFRGHHESYDRFSGQSY